ncbi:MAG TPA: SiaB family protein kinase [Opitutaceae bacterium]
MDPHHLHDHYLAARDQHIVLSFMGVVTQELLVGYAKFIPQQAGLSDNSRLVLFGTFVELAQNILRYSAERAGAAGQERGIGLVLVSEQEKTFTVASGNLVERETADRLQTQLAALATLDRDGLKALHRERRRAGPPPGSQGAGLGLIEVARRAAGPLAWSLAPQPDARVFFSLSVPVAKE